MLQNILTKGNDVLLSYSEHGYFAFKSIFIKEEKDVRGI